MKILCMKKHILSVVAVVVGLVAFCFFSPRVQAVGGTITGSSAYAWGENIGWINFLASGSNVVISDTAITGYAWSPNYGWINLSPTNSGVTNTSGGVLGGRAWSSGLGWVPFTGVTINTSGKFTGMAGTAGSTAGRINFDCANCSVVTDWRPSSVASTSTSSTTASTSTSTAGSAACSDAKPGGAPTLVSISSAQNSVTLTWSKASNPVSNYLIAYGDSPHTFQYGNPNVGGSGTINYTVRGLSGGTTYYFKAKAINGCMPGDYSNVLSATPSGGVTTSPAQGFIPATAIPGQLFDIALTVDQSLINDSRKLTARVTFTSFGSKATPVEMEFVILDGVGKQLYKTTGKTVIQTEGVYNQAFKDFVVPDGKYTLVLNTVYNTNVRDEFRAPFEIKSLPWPFPSWYWLIIIPVLLLVIRYFFKRRKNETIFPK